MFAVSKFLIATRDTVQLFTPDEMRKMALTYSPHRLENPNLAQTVISSVEIVGTNDKNCPIGISMHPTVDALCGTCLDAENEPMLAVFMPLANISDPPKSRLKEIPTEDALRKMIAPLVDVTRKPHLTADDTARPTFVIDTTNPVYLALQKSFVDEIATIDDHLKHKVDSPSAVSVSNKAALQDILERHVLEHAVVDTSKTGLSLKIKPLESMPDEEKARMVCMVVAVTMGFVEDKQEQQKTAGQE